MPPPHCRKGSCRYVIGSFDVKKMNQTKPFIEFLFFKIFFFRFFGRRNGPNIVECHMYKVTKKVGTYFSTSILRLNWKSRTQTNWDSTHCRTVCSGKLTLVLSIKYYLPINFYTVALWPMYVCNETPQKKDSKLYIF